MHLIIVASILFCAWWWGDWRNWRKYHSTMLYIAMSNLLYNFIYHDHYLWQFKADSLFSYTIIELLYTFIIFPATALLLLSNFPKDTKRQFIRVALSALVYITVEWASLVYGRMSHNYGWNMWWSLAWDSMMFPMWILHYRKPLTAYAFSILVVVVMVLIFPVSL